MSELIERLRMCASFTQEAEDDALMKEAADALEAKDKLIAELVEALTNLRELNTTGEDENGHRWSHSDLIDQEIMLALSKANLMERNAPVTQIAAE